MYEAEDFLMISGIQHFAFCRRQWALIHVECQWQENLRTVEGNIVHEKCHDDTFTEMRRDRLVTRGMRVFSATLGATGQCDVVEFEKAEKGTMLAGRDGLWRVIPIEYKRGQVKENLSDTLQLCTQAMCLEEMLCCQISSGFLFYDATHRRESVAFTADLRQQVKDIFAEMHEYYHRGYTPKVKPTKQCQACSLKELCLPKLCKKLSVTGYYRGKLEESS